MKTPKTPSLEWVLKAALLGQKNGPWKYPKNKAGFGSNMFFFIGLIVVDGQKEIKWPFPSSCLFSTGQEVSWRWDTERPVHQSKSQLAPSDVPQWPLPPLLQLLPSCSLIHRSLSPKSSWLFAFFVQSVITEHNIGLESYEGKGEGKRMTAALGESSTVQP